MIAPLSHAPRACALTLALLALACRPGAPGRIDQADEFADQRGILPSGLQLDPEGSIHDIGQFPLNMIPAPDGLRMVLLLSGRRDQGIQVVDRKTGIVLQTLPQPAGFIGLAFGTDRRTLFASGGNQDVVYRYEWTGAGARRIDSLVLAVKPYASRSGTRYPSGLALAPDGRALYVAENLAESLAVIDLTTGKVTQRIPAGRYPYGVVVAPSGTVYVSASEGNEVHSFRPDGSGRLMPASVIPVARHPSALLLNRSGDRLFVASGSTDRLSVVDTRTGRVITELRNPAPAGPSQGSTPTALALSEDGTRLFITEADNNAVAVFELGALTAGVSTGTGEDRLIGRIPTGWYPTALAVSGDTLMVVNAKGRGTGGSTLMISTAARATPAQLATLSARVARANNWDRERTPFR